MIIAVCLLLGGTAFAQSIPADSLGSYRRHAFHTLAAGDTVGAAELYKLLALGGDALSGYCLYEIYSKGEGVWNNPEEAEKWRSMAQEMMVGERQNSGRQQEIKTQHETPHSVEELLNQSGYLIEQGAMKKNSAIMLSIIGGVAGGTFTGLGMSLNAMGLIVVGGIIAGGCGVAALVLDIAGNRQIKHGGALLGRARITGTGITVSF